jgi:ketol-acid reductoisomerase
MAKIDFGGVVEDVITAEEFTLEKARQVLANETIAVLGYGVQGPAQALNMRDNGFSVIIGQLERIKNAGKRLSPTDSFRAKPFFR